MTTQTLSRVTLQTLRNYTTAAQRTVTATRLGGHRLVGAVDGALRTRVYARTAKVLPQTIGRLDEMRDGVTGLVTKGIDRLAQRTEKAIEVTAAVAAEQVARAARLASTVENPIVANGLQSAARLTMPGAQLALAWSSKVAEGAEALAQAAGARPVRRAVRRAAAGTKRKAAPVARRAQRAARAATTRARRSTAAVAETAKKSTARAKRAVRTVKAEAAQAAAA